MTINEVADFLGVSKQTVYQWVCQRKIPHIKIGRLVRFSKPALVLWLQSKERHEKNIKTKLGKKAGDVLFEKVKAEVL